MAKRIAGVTEKLLECAKAEFMRNGYENASLRVIAEKAGSSKGAIYIRYPDKESLYRSLVQPAMDDFCGLIQSTLEQFNQLPGVEQTSQMYSFSDHGFWASVDYIYDHFDEFKLLLTSGENSTYQEFLHRIVELDKGKLYSYQGGYEKYLELKAERMEMAEAAERRRQSILRTEIAWMQRGARARSTKQKAHIQRYEALRDQDGPQYDRNVQLESIASRLGRTTVELKDICKSYGDRIHEIRKKGESFII